MPKAKKSVIETHGKVETPKFEPTTLEQVWGVTDMTKYGTSSEAEYNNRLSNMTRSDLEAHARQLGVIITLDSHRLKDKLLAEFRSYNAMLHKPAVNHPRPNPNEAALKVLAEGK